MIRKRLIESALCAALAWLAPAVLHAQCDKPTQAGSPAQSDCTTAASDTTPPAPVTAPPKPNVPAVVDTEDDSLSYDTGAGARIDYETGDLCVTRGTTGVCLDDEE